jgi:hypothetical protein
MISEKLLKLIKRLDEKTSAKAIPWEETAAQNAFQVSFPNQSVAIYRDVDYTGNEFYLIKVRDQDGNTLDEYSTFTRVEPELLQLVYPDHPKPSSATIYPVMERIHENARRQVLNVDRAIDDILSELETD